MLKQGRVPVTIPLLIKVVTPVQISDGQGFDFFDYFCENEKLFVLSPIKMIERLKQKQKIKDFIGRCSTIKDDELGQLKRDMLMMLGDNKQALAEYAIPLQPDFKFTGINPRQHVEQFMRNPLSNKPYIPGSSIKGAFRTAYINHNKKEAISKKGINSSIVLENTMLNIEDVDSHSDDPLRHYKFSDFHLVGGSPFIGSMKYMHEFNKAHPKGDNKVVAEYMSSGSQFLGSEIGRAHV